MKWLKGMTVLMVAVIVLSGSIFSTHAQEDDRADIIERLAAIDDFTPQHQIITYENEADYSGNITLASEKYTFARLLITSGTKTIFNIHQANEAIMETFRINYTETVSNGEFTAYLVEGEYRFVDGRLYMNAAYLKKEGDLADLPDGWFELTSADEVDDWEIFNTLDIDALLDPKEKNDEFLANLEDAMPMVTYLRDDNNGQNVVLAITPRSLEDGTAVDAIQLTFDKAAFRELLIYLSANSTYENLSDASQLELSYLLTPDNILQGASFDTTIATVAFDLHDTEPFEYSEGSIAMYIISGVSSEWYDYPDDLSPIEAPELAE